MLTKINELTPEKLQTKNRFSKPYDTNKLVARKLNIEEYNGLSKQLLDPVSQAYYQTATN